jgi:hypothetical protein
MNIGDRVSQSTWNRPGEVGTVIDIDDKLDDPVFPLLLVKVIYRDGHWCWCKPEELKKEN